MLSKKIHRYIYIFSLILLGVSSPFSVFLMSVSQFLLATNWLLELDFKNKWERLKSNKPALYLIALFLLHVLWMINSSNLEYGWHDIRIKLPLFVLALLIGSSEKLEFLELKIILNFFTLAVIASSMVSVSIYWGIIDREITDVRQISIFISHIRLSLLSNLGIFISYYFFQRTNNTIWRILYLFSGLWLLLFLFILNAYTGIFIFVIVFGVLLFRSLLQTKKAGVKWAMLFSILALLTSVLWFSVESYHRFYSIDTELNPKELSRHTQKGNPYEHNPYLKQIENGHYVYLYISPKELEEEWNKRSSIPYKDGLNKKGEPLKYTLFHYLTSLNLRKDAEGVHHLSEQDIQMIEDGYSNWIYKDKYSLYTKVYPLLKQWYLYREIDYAEGASVIQRIEYLKIARQIIKQNFWFGVGTGDVDDAFKEHYANGESILSEEFQHRSHNQFATFFISFGIFGFLLAFYFMFSPIIRERKQFLPLVFILTAFLSMINEDTLETQAGITFFTFFYVLFFVAFSSEYYPKIETLIKKTD